MPYWIKNYQEAELVENYLNSYEEETSNIVTSMEVDFIEKQIKPHKNSKIVDVCCANGRHLLELARRGYNFNRC